MDFQTKVELPAGLPPVSHAERILLMGSCFAENMGRLLAENKFRVDMNPFGILYNPLSVSTALVEILKGNGAMALFVVRKQKLKEHCENDTMWKKCTIWRSLWNDRRY